MQLSCATAARHTSTLNTMGATTTAQPVSECKNSSTTTRQTTATYVADALRQLWSHIAICLGIHAPYFRSLRRSPRNKFLIIAFLAPLFYAAALATAPAAALSTTTAITATAATVVATATTAAAAMLSFKAPSAMRMPIGPGECPSMDVRNFCDDLLQLENCTAIRGFLTIVLISRSPLFHYGNETHNKADMCDYSKYSFPLLREITDFLIFYSVKGLRSIRQLFPNLTVIRGRRLFLNYALGVSNMPDLELLEFKSLIAIQRGHVYIGSNAKLCNLEKINWDRLTLSVGENHIYPVAPDTCPTKSLCIGCDTEYCWSNDVCQKFDNYNLIDPTQGIQHCHEECLGGCYNRTREGCAVCRRLTDHGVCLKECPADKYLLEDVQRCLTEDECKNYYELNPIDAQCVENCQSGFMPEILYSSTYLLKGRGVRPGGCAPCEALFADAPIYINHLADMEQVSGCEVINGSLIISIRNKWNLQELIQGFKNVREIRGFLFIYRSSFLTSLEFLSPLQKITGGNLYRKHYSLIIFENNNLQELWTPENLELERGGMYVEGNTKLCNRKLREFTKKIVHDKTDDLLQVNDQEVLCEPAKLMVQTEVLSHSEIFFSWRKDQTAEEVEVLYHAMDPGELIIGHSELDTDVCNRIRWHRLLIFKNELSGNATHYSYIIRNLKAATRYACLIKTFGREDITRDARSDIVYVTTGMDLPPAPMLKVTKITDVSLTLQIEPQKADIVLVKYYLLELYELLDDQTMLDKRDYCEQPTYLYDDKPDFNNEDYEACCSRMQEEAEDEFFKQQMRAEFSCDLEHKHYCVDFTTTYTTAKDASPIAIAKPKLTLRLEETNVTTQLLAHLERYHLYVVQVKACNEIGCGTYSTIWARTNFSIAGDRLEDLRACRVDKTHDFHVQFNDPPHPNGPVVSYVIHYRLNVPDEKSHQTHVECVTHSQHVANGFHHVAQLNASFNEVAVRVHSLAGGIFTHWVEVGICSATKYASIVNNNSVAIIAKENGVNIFLIFILIGGLIALIWLCYKRCMWRKLLEVCRSFTRLCNWHPQFLRSEPISEDRQILVQEFETVRFRNNPDDDQKCLE